MKLRDCVPFLLVHIVSCYEIMERREHKEPTYFITSLPQFLYLFLHYRTFFGNHISYYILGTNSQALIGRKLEGSVSKETESYFKCKSYYAV